MAPIRTIVVDDEPIARQVLREELEQFADVELADEAENGVQALERILERLNRHFSRSRS